MTDAPQSPDPRTLVDPDLLYRSERVPEGGGILLCALLAILFYASLVVAYFWSV